MAKQQIDPIDAPRRRTETDFQQRSYQVADPRTDGNIPSRTTTESRATAAIRVTMSLEATEALDERLARRPRMHSAAEQDQVPGVAAYRTNMGELRPDQRLVQVEATASADQALHATRK